MNRLRMVPAIVLLCCGAQASAQAASGNGVLASLSRCRGISAPDARLACFEAATTALEEAVWSKEVTIVGRQDIQKARRSLFGFPVPHIPFFGGGDRDAGATHEEFEELSTTIGSAHAVANGRVELRLAEGDQVWVTTDPMPFPPKNGAKVRIRRGALGNYFIAIQGERSVRGMRVR